MPSKWLMPSSAGLRKPTDANKENANVVNTPRYLEHGGLDKPSRTAPGVNKAGMRKNLFAVVKPGGGSAR